VRRLEERAEVVEADFHNKHGQRNEPADLKNGGPRYRLANAEILRFAQNDTRNEPADLKNGGSR
jgi:hypothetical protein